jgi:hypothetical protein
MNASMSATASAEAGSFFSQSFQVQVHHIVGVRKGGAPFDPANCACLCRLHHETLNVVGSFSPI